MLTPMSVAGHPIHPVLVSFPIVLWISSLVCDVIWLGGYQPLWAQIAYISMWGGMIMVIWAAVPGLLDMLAIKPGTPIKRIAYIHMTMNLSLIVMYGLNLWWRSQAEEPQIGPVVLSFISICALAISAWLGGEMVHRKGVGVEPVRNSSELDINNR